jgi:hypothetical protein
VELISNYISMMRLGTPGERQAKGITILPFLCCYYGSTALHMYAKLLVDWYMVSLLDTAL